MSCSLRQVVFEVHGKRNRSFTPWPITAKLQGLLCFPVVLKLAAYLDYSHREAHAAWQTRRLARIPPLRDRCSAEVVSYGIPTVCPFGSLCRVCSTDDHSHRKLDPKVAETTWVHQVFGGRLRSRVTCMVCGHNSDTFDRILDLSVDIYGCSSLKEALRKFIAVDHLKGADKYKCEKYVGLEQLCIYTDSRHPCTDARRPLLLRSNLPYMKLRSF